MRPPDPVRALGVLQAAVFTDRRLRLRYRSSGRREPAAGGPGAHREPAASGRQAERSASVQVVDPYGLVCKAGIWYLVADQDGEPRLFRVSRVVSAVADEEPVRRRDGVSLAGVWASLRREVEDRPAPLLVLVRVRREWLDMFGRICAANLTGPLPVATGEWIELRLRFAAVKATRTLLSFGANVEVLSPPEVRAELAAVASEIVDLYSNLRLS
jgi:predicted DNA-binding transcriptional regulator YafY